MTDGEKVGWWWKYGKVRAGSLHDLYCVWADSKLCKGKSIFKKLYPDTKSQTH